MAFRQYTRCYIHTPGDKPFNRDDLLGFALGASAPGLITAILAFLAGANLIGFIAIAVQYAATIVAIADRWLFHRLVCLSGDQCAVGRVDPIEKPATLGEFDNDDYFDMRLMPHRHNDEYIAPNFGFFAPPSGSDPLATPPWKTNSPPRPGPSADGKTEQTKSNDIFLDGLQGSTLIRPTLQDLPYNPVEIGTTPVHGFNEKENGLVSRCALHCEAEGNFWQAMRDYAPLLGTAVGVGAAAGAAAGCALGGFFGPIGCIIGAIVGAIAGAIGAAGVGANTAFHSDPGDYNDANVGDTPLGRLAPNDMVVVYGTHVYDGFHEGWHEFHPLKAVMRFNDMFVFGRHQYLEWDPDFPDSGLPPTGLSADDMRRGLDSPAFKAAAQAVRDQWCIAISQRFDPAIRQNQEKPEHRWTAHPAVDGCRPNESPPSSAPPIH